MEVLAVPIPLQALVNWLIGVALVERLTDPQTARGRMAATCLFIESADPSAARIVIAISPENLMHLIDQFSGIAQVFFIVRLSEQLKKVAGCKCIGPKISLVMLRRGTQAGSHGEFGHQSSRLGRCAVRDRFPI